MTNNIDNLNGEMLARACLFAAKGDVRYYLNGVFIEKRPGGGVYIVATNGHYLCVYEDKEAFAHAAFKDVILNVYQENSKKLNPVFTQLKKTDSKRVDLVDMDASADGTIDPFPKQLYLVQADEDGDNVATRLPVLEGTFPDWQRVVSSGFDLSEPVSFNTKYLAKLKDFVLKEENKKFPTMALVSGSPTGSNVWQSENGVVVIMPTRLGEDFKISKLVEPEVIELEEVELEEVELEEVAQ